MKKLIFLLFISLFVLLMSACSDSEKDSTSNGPYTLEKAQNNGDVISYGISQKSENLVKMLDFVDSVEKGEEAKVRITNFWETKSFIDDLDYDGTKITLTHHVKPEDEGTMSTCKNIHDQDNGVMILQECEGEQSEIFVLVTQVFLYNKAKVEFENQQSK